MSDIEKPIEVNATPVPAQIEASIRQVVLMVGPLLGGIGYVGLAGKLNDALVLAGPAAAIIAFVWGQVATRQAAKKLTITARAAPNRTAIVKGE